MRENEKFVINKDYDEYPGGIPTEVIRSKSEEKYTIDDMIQMLYIAKERWGNVPVSISDVGFESSHFNDTIGISQLYLYKKGNGDNFCVIESTP